MAMADSPASMSCTRITLLEPGMARSCLASACMNSLPFALPMDSSMILNQVYSSVPRLIRPFHLGLSKSALVRGASAAETCLVLNASAIGVTSNACQ